MGAFLYRYNRQLRELSDAVMGNYFENSRDIVVITGGASGLGKEIATQFATHGGKVVVLDIKTPLEEGKIPGVHYYDCDVSDPNQVIDVFQTIVREVGKITILINNAGITKGKSLVELAYSEIEQVIQTNLLASFYTIKAALPDMIDMKRGYIVTIGSVLGYMSPARLSAYGASKSGLIALHESLTYELGSPSWNVSGIKTLLVCPGQVKTGLFSGVKTPTTLLAPELDPVYVAKHVYSAMEIGRKGEIKMPFYGNFIPVFRAFPWFVVEIVRKSSGIDKSMQTFKNTLSRVASRTSLIPVPESSRTNPEVSTDPSANELKEIEVTTITV